MTEENNDKEIIKELREEIQVLKQQIAALQRRNFSSSSEQLDPNQGSLFDEHSVFTSPEQTGDQTKASNDEVSAKKRASKKTHRRQDQLAKNIPVKNEYHGLPDECPNGHDTTALSVVNQTLMREELIQVPARVYILRVYGVSYKCKECLKDEAAVSIFKTMLPKALISHSLASASLVAEILYNKFVMGVPLYRQLTEIKRLGYTTSEGTLANWIIKTAKLVEPLYDLLHKQLLTNSHLQGDETPIQVLHEPGKKPTSKSYMWVAQTVPKTSESIVYYAYGSTRSQGFAQKMYLNYTGTLQCDGYAGHNIIAQDKRAGCWAHVRRKFVDDYRDHGSTDKSIPLQLLDQMFTMERAWQHLSPKARRRRRRSQLRKVVRHFWQWIDHYDGLSKSSLGKAVAYASHQRDSLNLILNDGLVDWSNNAAERSMKSMVIGRKNWLFSTSTDGAKSTAAWMTIVESAKANHIDPREYLTYLLTEFPKLPTFPKEEQLAAYLPWNFKKDAPKASLKERGQQRLKQKQDEQEKEKVA